MKSKDQQMLEEAYQTVKYPKQKQLVGILTVDDVIDIVEMDDYYEDLFQQVECDEQGFYWVDDNVMCVGTDKNAIEQKLLDKSSQN